MRPIRTREDLIEVALRLAPTKACARAIREGGLRNHGGYTLPDFPPLFAVSVITKHARKYHYWIVAGAADWYRHDNESLPLARYWDGRPDSNFAIDGDHT